MAPSSCVGRSELSQLLQTLEDAPEDVATRVAAAELAVRLALLTGEARTADIAESLLVDLPEDAGTDARSKLEHIAATARATRRAIVLARGLDLSSPAVLADTALQEAGQLAREIEALAGDKPPLAQAMLDLALARHPGSAELTELSRTLSGSVEQKNLQL